MRRIADLAMVAVELQLCAMIRHGPISGWLGLHPPDAPVSAERPVELCWIHDHNFTPRPNIGPYIVTSHLKEPFL